MAYKSFNQRFPTFKWVLLLAVVFALPLTMWSLNNVSTNTQQHAAYTCSSLGGACTSNTICKMEGYGTISGGVCTTGKVCCRFTAPKLPTCVSRGGSCVIPTICHTEGRVVLSGTSCSGVTVCCKF